MTDKFSEGVKKVSAIASEMHQAIIQLAGPRSWFETRERWLSNAARKAGISYRAAKALFYCEIADPRSSVVESVRQAIAVTKHQEAKARDEYRELSERLAALEARLFSADPDFHGENAAGLRSQFRVDGGENRPMDRG